MITEKEQVLKNKSGEQFTEVELVGNSIDELIIEALKKIRPKSRINYAMFMRDDLHTHGNCLVDIHAGQGRYINVILKK